MARKSGSFGRITGPAIREAAQRLFAQYGYAAVSMREIAREVGVQVGALYLYTPDKQSLLLDLMLTHLDELIDAWRSVDRAEVPAKRLEAFVAFHIDYHLDRRDAVFLAYMELRSLNEESFQVIEAARRRYELILEGILADGAREGVFEIADVRLSTMAILAMLTGPHVWFREDGRLTRSDIQTMYGDLVQRMVSA